MVPLKKRIAVEMANVEQTLANLDEALSRDPLTVVELAAIGAFLHNFYGGIENIAKQVLLERGKIIPASGSWHKELLEAVVGEGILSRSMADDLYDYLAFRHFFSHGYGHMLSAEKLAPLSKSARGIWSRFVLEIEQASRPQ